MRSVGECQALEQPCFGCREHCAMDVWKLQHFVAYGSAQVSFQTIFMEQKGQMIIL